LFEHVKTTPSQPALGSLLAFATANKDKLKDVLTDDRQIVYEIHDILKAYYSTSVQHYTDSVCKDGLKDSFVKEVMDLFSNEFVDSLSDEEVSSIAAESVPDRKARRELKEDIQNLERAISESEAILREPIAGWEGR
jgi:SAM-dependent MidA family methyltransferase